MSSTKKTLAVEMSTGNFKAVFSSFADDISWDIVGEKLIKGKAAVIEYCDGIAAYFASVTTTFNISNVIVEGNMVAIDGTAVFINKKGKSTKVSSCDVYCFKNEKLSSITSYCIVTEKESQ